jgi:hypothetical protein
MKTQILSKDLKLAKELDGIIFLNKGDTVIFEGAIYEVENRVLDLNKKLLVIKVRQVY